MEILEKSSQNNDIVFFEDGSWDAIGAGGQLTCQKLRFSALLFLCNPNILSSNLFQILQLK